MQASPSPPPTRSIRWPARGRSWIAAALLAGLGGCGGGLYIVIGPDDHPPTVSLSVSTTSAPAGSTIGLFADASDDYGVDSVVFFRIDAGGNVRLGGVGVRPFQISTVLPSSTTGSVSYFARAYDTAGQTTDSAPVTITVQ